MRDRTALARTRGLTSWAPSPVRPRPRSGPARRSGAIESPRLRPRPGASRLRVPGGSESPSGMDAGLTRSCRVGTERWGVGGVRGGRHSMGRRHEAVGRVVSGGAIGTALGTGESRDGWAWVVAGWEGHKLGSRTCTRRPWAWVQWGRLAQPCLLSSVRCEGPHAAV